MLPERCVVCAYEASTSYFLLPTHYVLLTTHYSLLTTHYLLRATHYLLLTFVAAGIGGGVVLVWKAARTENRA